MCNLVMLGCMAIASIGALWSSAACGEEIAPWAKRTSAACDRVKRGVGELSALEDRLRRQTGWQEKWFAETEAKLSANWLIEASSEQRALYGKRQTKRQELSRDLIDVYMTCGIILPIGRRAPEELLSQATDIVQEYLELAYAKRQMSFEEVFSEQLDANLLALSGPYYRQAAALLFRHIEFSFVGESDVEIERFGMSLTQQQKWYCRAFDKWYRRQYQSDSAWVIEGGVPKLKPRTSDKYRFVEVVDTQGRDIEEELILSKLEGVLNRK